MDQVTLQRLLTGDHGTFGVWRAPGWNALSIEPPWRDNIMTISCIPAGEYQVDYTYSPKFKRKMYLVRDVPNRSGIRIHSGNLAGDKTKGLITHFAGCIGLGVRQGVMEGQRCVHISSPAVLTFERLMGGRSFKLRITGGSGDA